MVEPTVMSVRLDAGKVHILFAFVSYASSANIMDVLVLRGNVIVLLQNVTV